MANFTAFLGALMGMMLQVQEKSSDYVLYFHLKIAAMFPNVLTLGPPSPTPSPIIISILNTITSTSTIMSSHPTATLSAFETVIRSASSMTTPAITETLAAVSSKVTSTTTYIEAGTTAYYHRVPTPTASILSSSGRPVEMKDAVVDFIWKIKDLCASISVVDFILKIKDLCGSISVFDFILKIKHFCASISISVDDRLWIAALVLLALVLLFAFAGSKVFKTKASSLPVPAGSDPSQITTNARRPKPWSWCDRIVQTLQESRSSLKHIVEKRASPWVKQFCNDPLSTPRALCLATFKRFEPFFWTCFLLLMSVVLYIIIHMIWNILATTFAIVLVIAIIVNMMLCCCSPRTKAPSPKKTRLPSQRSMLSSSTSTKDDLSTEKEGHQSESELQSSPVPSEESAAQRQPGQPELVLCRQEKEKLAQDLDAAREEIDKLKRLSVRAEENINNWKSCARDAEQRVTEAKTQAIRQQAILQKEADEKKAASEMQARTTQLEAVVVEERNSRGLVEAASVTETKLQGEVAAHTQTRAEKMEMEAAASVIETKLQEQVAAHAQTRAAKEEMGARLDSALQRIRELEEALQQQQQASATSKDAPPFEKPATPPMDGVEVERDLPGDAPLGTDDNQASNGHVETTPEERSTTTTTQPENETTPASSSPPCGSPESRATREALDELLIGGAVVAAQEGPSSFEGRDGSPQENHSQKSPFTQQWQSGLGPAYMITMRATPTPTQNTPPSVESAEPQTTTVQEPTLPTRPHTPVAVVPETEEDEFGSSPISSMPSAFLCEAPSGVESPAINEDMPMMEADSFDFSEFLVDIPEEGEMDFTHDSLPSQPAPGFVPTGGAGLIVNPMANNGNFSSPQTGPQPFRIPGLNNYEDDARAERGDNEMTDVDNNHVQNGHVVNQGGNGNGSPFGGNQPSSTGAGAVEPEAPAPLKAPQSSASRWQKPPAGIRRSGPTPFTMG